MPPTVRTAQVLLLLPPLAAAGLMAVGMLAGGDGSGGGGSLCLLVFFVAVAVEAGVLAVGLRGRGGGARLLAEVAGWVWVAVGGGATVLGVPLIGAYGLGCWLILFVGLPMLACGFGLAAAAGSAAARAWCREP